MTKPELMTTIRLYRVGDKTLEEVRDAVEAYSSASNNGKPIVSGSLPQSTKDEVIHVLEVLIKNFHSVDADCQPTASIVEIVDGWISARDLLCRLRQ